MAEMSALEMHNLSKMSGDDIKIVKLTKIWLTFAAFALFCICGSITLVNIYSPFVSVTRTTEQVANPNRLITTPSQPQDLGYVILGGDGKPLGTVDQK